MNRDLRREGNNNMGIMGVITRILLSVFLISGFDRAWSTESQAPASSASRASAIEEAQMAIQATIDGAGGWRAWNETLVPFHADMAARIADAKGQEAAFLVGPARSLFTVALTEFAMAHPSPDLAGSPHRIEDTTAYRTLVPLYRALAQQGVDLIFIPIPQKEEVYPRSLSEHAPTTVPLYPQRYRYMEALLAAGVEVIDLLPTFQAARTEGERPLYPTSDLHWGDRAMGTATEILAERIKRYGLAVPGAPNPYRARPYHLDVEGPLVKYFVPPEEQLHYDRLVEDGVQVLLPDGTPYEYNGVDDAPILMLGDSFMMRARSGGSWAARLAYELGVPVTGFMQNQKGAQSVARIFARKGPAFYAERRVIVLYVVGGMLSRQWYAQPLPG